VTGLGILLLFSGLAFLLLALTFLHAAQYLLPVSAALLAGFWAVERWGAAPLLEPAVLGAPGLLVGLMAALLSYAVLFGGLLAVPLLLERVFGATPGQAGLVLTVVPVTLALVAEGGGLLSDRYGTRLPTVAGMGFAVGGLLLMEGIQSAADPRLFAGLALLGLGMGLFIPANNAGVMKAAPPSSLGLTGGLINMMRGLGASLGIALVSAVLLVRVGRGPSHVASSAGVGSGVGIALEGLAAAALLGLLLSLRSRRPTT
jgi:MFS family permease